MKLWKNNIRKVIPYVPGEQPKEKNLIKLNTNENPYPPAPEVKKVMEQMDTSDLKKYPDPNASELVNEIASYHGLNPNQVFVGVGSDDVLAMSFMTFFNSEKPILFPDITYSFYTVWADLFRISYVQVPVDETFQIDINDYIQENGGIIFPNPNAPTGIELPLAKIKELLAANQDVIVIVDEAYIDFGGESAIKLLDEYENLVVVQTFSKSRSMAGIRIGYALAAPCLIEALNAVKHSYNSYTMNLPSIQAGVASIKNEVYFRKMLDCVMKTRVESKMKLERLGFHCLDSSANFLFVTHNLLPAEEIFLYLKSKHIFVRYFKKNRIDNYLRITIGTEKEMECLIDSLETLIKEKCK